MSLTTAIDALLDFVKAHIAIHPRRRPPFDVPQFEVLDRTVYDEADRLGLPGDMPWPDCGQTRRTFGRTNLPGCRGTQYDPPGQFEPMPSSVPRWRSAMLNLRALAETTEERGNPTGWDGNRRRQERRRAGAGGPKSSVQAKAVKRDPRTEARDRWLYRQAKRKNAPTWKSLAIQLERIAKDRHWQKLTTPQGVKQAVDRYIERNGLAPLPPRKEA